MKKSKKSRIQLHVGDMLRKFVDSNRITEAAWARRQGVSSKTVASYLKNEDIRINTLPPDLPHCPIANDQFMANLQNENEDLKKENELLKSLISK